MHGLAALLHLPQRIGISELLLVGNQIAPPQAAQYLRREQVGGCCQQPRQHLPLVGLVEERRVMDGVAVVVAAEVGVAVGVHKQQLCTSTPGAPDMPGKVLQVCSMMRWGAPATNPGDATKREG